MIKEKINEHVFNTEATWSIKDKKGVLLSGKRKAITFSPPPEFGGSDDNWSPEHLLCASLAGCYLTTFMHFADLMKVEVTSIAVSTDVKFEKREKGFEATRFIIIPDVVFSVEPDSKTAEQLYARAKKYCLISNSVKGEVIVDLPVLN